VPQLTAHYEETLDPAEKERTLFALTYGANVTELLAYAHSGNVRILTCHVAVKCWCCMCEGARFDQDLMEGA
jgi:hypothetical protein